MSVLRYVFVCSILVCGCLVDIGILALYAGSDAFRYFTFWAITAHAASDLALVFTLTWSFLSREDTVARRLHDGHVYSFVPVRVLLAFTVFLAIHILVVVYPTRVLGDSEFASDEIAIRKHADFFTHTLPLIDAILIAVLMYPDAQRAYEIIGLEMQAQRVYVQFLWVFMLNVAYALCYDVTDVYGTPEAPTFLVTFASNVTGAFLLFVATMSIAGTDGTLS